jgi:hypothetical protein
MSTLTLNGSKLPALFYLSDYLNNEAEAVRLTGLKAGQTAVVDVSLDGGYTNPDTPKVANWKSAVTGREGVHTAMLAITKGTGFTVRFEDKAEIKNSRGRGVGISECTDFGLEDAWVRGARTAGIALSKCSRFTITRPVTIDTSNYQDAKGQGKNYAGSLKLENCSDYTIIDAASLDHMGNGLTPTECATGLWIAPFAFGVHGANIYINASPGQTVLGGMAIGGTARNRPPLYVANSEEENVGAPEDIRFEECYGLDGDWGLGFWGNEGKRGIIIQRAAMVDSLLISDQPMKIHPNATVLDFDSTGTLLLKPGDLPAATVDNLRTLADAAAEAYRAHADKAAIYGARWALEAAFAEQLDPEPEPEPTAPIDRAALLAWFEEGEALPLQLRDWHARGWAIARGE